MIENSTNFLQIVTKIPQQQRKQLYVLLEEFETECEEKNNDDKLPIILKRTNIFEKIFKKILISIRKQQDSKKMAIDILDGKREDSKLFILCQGDRLVRF